MKERILTLLKAADPEARTLGVILLEKTYPEDKWSSLLEEAFSRELGHGGPYYLSPNWKIINHKIEIHNDMFTWLSTPLVKDPTKLLKLVPCSPK